MEWGLRKYPDSANVIWGGDPNCEHEFKPYEKRQHSGRLEGQINGKDTCYFHHENIPDIIVKIPGFCSKCGAWFGQLGLEPTLDLYIEHLFQIMKELKRVLKPSGVIFINMGSNYSNGKAKIVVKEWYE